METRQTSKARDHQEQGVVKKRGRKRKDETRNEMVAAKKGNLENSSQVGKIVQQQQQQSNNSIRSSNLPIKTFISSSNNPNINSAKKFKEDPVCEIILEDDIKKEMQPARTEDVDKYLCPFEDCQSESKNVQSIKIHLALVHYKKIIQIEFPNWKKQKCEECNKSIGQMTAYYLHMANHKKYKYMDYSADQLRAPKSRVPRSTDLNTRVDRNEKFSKSSSPLSCKATITPRSSSSSPFQNPGYVKTIKSSNSPQVTRNSSFVSTYASSAKSQLLRTPQSKVFGKTSSTSTLTPVIKGAPGPSGLKISAPMSERKQVYTKIVDRRLSDGQPRASFIRTGAGEKSRSTLSVKDLRKPRGT